MDRNIINNLDNELTINIVSQKHGIKIIDANTSIKVINYQNIAKYVNQGFFVYIDHNGQQFIAVNNCNILPNLLNSTLKITLIKKHDFHLILEQNFSHLNTVKAKYWLDFITFTPTTKNINFLKITIGFNILFFSCLFESTTIFHLLNNLCYFTQNMLKIFLFKQSIINNCDLLIPLSQNDRASRIKLPTYTILVPLYQEAAKLESIINSLVSLNYPKHLLDIKIIIEADDYLLVNLLANYNLPFYIQVLIVPYSIPRTKPKALNYAITYARGEYVTIYDAEDQPEPDQLLKVVNAFQQLPKEFACIQAKLSFYNAHENLLTKFFSIEYTIWFEYLLKGLSLYNFPVPLGGTSNHFKADILRIIGYWDAYNVTEDAELGIRLYAHGYKTHIIDSYTFEEAPITIDNWINQRSRWIKGFIQTFAIFVAYKPKRTTFTYLQIIVTYIFIGLSTYSFYCFPWLIIIVIINSNPTIDYLWLINSFFALVYSYSAALYALYANNKSENKKRFHLLDYLGLIFWPLYFILHSVASYKAMWEIIRKPFAWNKTQHGISTQDNDKLLINVDQDS
ncbi:Glycosyl transferase 2 family protein [Candidatus Trichorickettsia mobilis]|uniref:Glycosyl transferase 2 family protein n=1 Tax=Candidatus Trichorickettsia mobilis TaxID=1346319 RepID=A0ABZ0UUU0_9RICK|nr:glycosyltransferase family 2 protein [Candidatus Trichorickettsia mobilis]WPY01423.1 Glycosyl transferase 2 family protein [Candidatus Trichorickettsia mobilis]